jgi:hypothetical protein
MYIAAAVDATPGFSLERSSSSRAAAEEGGKPEPILEAETPQECILLRGKAPDWSV